MKFRSRFAVVGTLLAVALALLVSLPALALDSTTSVTAGATLTLSVHPDDDTAATAANARDTRVLNVGGGTTVWVAASTPGYNRVLVQVDNVDPADSLEVAVRNSSTRKNLRVAQSRIVDGNTIYKTAEGVEGTIEELELLIVDDNDANTTDSITVTRVIDYVEAPDGLPTTAGDATFLVLASDAAAVPAATVNEELTINDGDSGATISGAANVEATYYLIAGNNDEIKVTATGTITDGPDADSDPDPFSVANDFSLKVDSQGPRISGITPAGGGNQSSDSAAFGATFTDPGSGLVTDAEQPEYGDGAVDDTDGDNDSITAAEPLTLAAANGAARDIRIHVFKGDHRTQAADFTDASDITSKGTSSWRTVTDGFSISIVDSPLATGDGGLVYYAFRAKDRVGNITISGQGNPNGMANHLLIVDRAEPQISDALAGRGYKASAKNPNDDANNLRSIKLVFSGGIVDAGVEALDVTTIEASDFTVVGSDGTEMEVVDVNTSPLPVDADEDPDITVNNVVYLILANDLPPAATPRITVIGSISDLAGNRLGAGNPGGSRTATDRTAPVFATTVTGSVAERVAVTGERDGQVTVRVVSNEALRNVPNLRIVKLIINDDNALAIGSNDDAINKAPVAVQGVDNTWELTTTVPNSGLYAVYVTGEDTSPDPNSGGTPAPEPAALINAETFEGLTLFEVDDSLALSTGSDGDFVLTPSPSAGKTQSVNPFIRINFGEASEYPRDTHKSVTLTKLVLRDADAVETDLLGTKGSVDSDSFLVSLNDLALGDYTLVVNGTDELGNSLSKDATFNFEVIQRPAHKVSLWPGNNLISVPGEPVDPSIDVVLPSSHPATAVLAYDPTDPVGPWLAATREPGGTWSGPLTQINQGKGYWVDTSTFSPLSVQLRERGSGEVPPTFPVTSGWNLIGVVAASNDALTESVAAKDYLASINWSVAYTYNTGSNDWTKITKTTTEPIPGVADDAEVKTRPSTLKPGQGVWVWAESADVLAP